ncbi:MAG: HAMP domain-containing protein [Desulfobacterales bacterium]|nr:HAMP domain-containing protein [Desulfobacterales bacterium]
MRFASIQTRLIGVALLFIVGTSITMGFIGIKLTARFLNVRFHENFRLLSDYLARNAELGVLLRDANMLNRLVNNMLKQEDVYGVSIHTVEGDVLISMQKPHPAKDVGTIETPIAQLQMQNRDLIDGDPGIDPVGRVILTYSRESLDHLIRDMTRTFILISVILSLFPVAWYWFLARSIISPLHDLLKVSREVSNGRLDVRAKEGTLIETKTLAKTFNEMLDALEQHRIKLEKAHSEMARQQTLAEVGKFSMMIAHEIKNPLAIIKGSLDILKKKEIPIETKKNMLGYLEEEVTRINRLVEDFLLFAKPKKAEVRPVNMVRFANDMAEKILFIANEQEVHIQTEIDKQICELLCDVHLLEQAILNIASNAVRIVGKGGIVTLKTLADALCWHFWVNDTGPGINESDIQRIFEPFFTTSAQGTGLGLAMAKDIIDIHHGQIIASNQESGGASFEIRLPRV